MFAQGSANGLPYKVISCAYGTHRLLLYIDRARIIPCEVNAHPIEPIGRGVLANTARFALYNMHRVSDMLCGVHINSDLPENI